MSLAKIKPLELSDNIQGRTAISQNPVSFRLYQTYKTYCSWSPYLNDNLLIFYGNDDEKEHVVSVFMENLLPRQFNYHWNTEATLETVETKTSHTYSDNIKDAVLKSYKTILSVKKQCEKNGILYPNKKFDFLFFEINKNTFQAIIDDEDVWDRLLWIIAQGAHYRFPVVVFAKNIDDLSSELVSAFRVALYLGEENMNYALSKYSNLDKGFFYTGKNLHGTAWFDDKQHLPMLQLQKHGEMNEWGRIVKDKKNIEKKVYNNFLEGLDD